MENSRCPPVQASASLQDTSSPLFRGLGSWGEGGVGVEGGEGFPLHIPSPHPALGSGGPGNPHYCRLCAMKRPVFFSIP